MMQTNQIEADIAEYARKKKLESQRKYRKQNREKIREYQREYRKQHRERILEYKRAYYARNCERLNNYMREYRARKKAEKSHRGAATPSAAKKNNTIK